MGTWHPEQSHWRVACHLQQVIGGIVSRRTGRNRRVAVGKILYRGKGAGAAIESVTMGE